MISDEEILLFCQNAAQIEITKGRSLQNELQNPNQDDIAGEFYDEESLISWYVVMRASEVFNTNQGRYPGTNLNSVKEDADQIAEIVSDILKKILPGSNSEGHKIAFKYSYEM
jgi:hypothetical protein